MIIQTQNYNAFQLRTHVKILENTVLHQSFTAITLECFQTIGESDTSDMTQDNIGYKVFITNARYAAYK